MLPRRPAGVSMVTGRTQDTFASADNDVSASPPPPALIQLGKRRKNYIILFFTFGPIGETIFRIEFHENLFVIVMFVDLKKKK